MPPSVLLSKTRLRIMKVMHLGVIALSILMITLITLDTLANISFLADENYLRVQFWCCLFFIADVLLEMCFYPKHLKYLSRHILFLLVSIPYLNIIHHFKIEVGSEVQYCMRFIPMIRAAYVFTIVTGVTASSRWVKNMLMTYMIVLIVAVYFCSLTFFVSEHGTNPLVPDYWSALQWSIMSLTTAGCSIHAMTPTGMVLGVTLSALGLIFFPIFTVFLTNNYANQQAATPASQTSGEVEVQQEAEKGQK